jgi:hypothetical protein
LRQNGMTKRKESSALPVLTLLLACAIPGAGHFYLGRARRGIIIFLAISALFWSGLAVGGVLTVDSQREKWWFAAQMLTGANGLAAWQLEKRAYRILDEDAGGESLEKKMVEKNIALVAPAETVARAYSGVAGLINLMCIFDALMLSLMGMRGESAPEKRRTKRLSEKDMETKP